MDGFTFLGVPADWLWVDFDNLVSPQISKKVFADGFRSAHRSPLARSSPPLLRLRTSKWGSARMDNSDCITIYNNSNAKLGVTARKVRAAARDGLLHSRVVGSGKETNIVLSG